MEQQSGAPPFLVWGDGTDRGVPTPGNRSARYELIHLRVRPDLDATMGVAGR
jgi:hypothetical protein